MAEKSTILSKKLISLNKSFNTFPTTRSKESKKKTLDNTTSVGQAAESSESLIDRKSSIFSSRFSNGKSKSIENERKSIDDCPTDSIKVADSRKVVKSASKSTNKSIRSSTNKYTSFFTSTITNTTKTPSVSSTKSSASSSKTNPSTLSTISHVSTSPLSSSPVRSIKSNSQKIRSPSNQASNSIPKFKLNNKKKPFVEPQWHADSQLATSKTSNKVNSKTTKLKEKTSFKSKTARTINTFVRPIKDSSLRFENRRLLFSSNSGNKSKNVENLSLNDDHMFDRDKQHTPTSENAGLKVSFDENTKIDRHRSNSDNARLGKKQNLIRSLRRSIFANQDLSPSCPSDRSLSLANKSLSNRMMGMISKGKNHLAIVRSHSLESNKFSAKRKNQQISKSQSKLIPQTEPTFDEYKFLPLKWLFANKNLDEQLIYIKFFKFYKCYDLIPNSSKLVVFDTQLLVNKAFSGLVTHGIKAAPLWDKSSQSYVGMLTISYFINILIDQYENSDLQSTHFEEQKLDLWKDYYTLSEKCFISIDPDANVFDAIHLLIKHKIHRLPVLDPHTQNVIYVLTHKRILKFMYIYYAFLPMPSFLQASIKSLKIGTYGVIETVTPYTCLLNALNKFISKNISSLPIVDNDGKLLDVFCKFDLFNLAANKMYTNLDISIKKALEQRVDSNCELLVTCYEDSTLHNVIELFVTHEAHRLIIVDSFDKVIGIICLSDVLKYLITEHGDQSKESNEEFAKNDSIKELNESKLIEESDARKSNQELNSQELNDKELKEDESNKDESANESKENLPNSEDISSAIESTGQVSHNRLDQL